MPLSQTQLVAFNAITNFVKALGTEFGNRQHSLALYARFVEHMNLSQEGAITKIVDGFNGFIAANQAAIEESSEEKLSDARIAYSDRVYLTLKPLFHMADAETKSVMWKHLITIYGILYPDSQAKEILKKMNSDTKSTESALIGEMVGKIVPHLNPEETNPMQAILGLVSSGVFTELLGTMQKGMDEGSINPSTLFGQVSSLLSQPDPTAKLIEDKKQA